MRTRPRGTGIGDSARLDLRIDCAQHRGLVHRAAGCRRWKDQCPSEFGQSPLRQPGVENRDSERRQSRSSSELWIRGLDRHPWRPGSYATNRQFCCFACLYASPQEERCQRPIPTFPPPLSGGQYRQRREQMSDECCPLGCTEETGGFVIGHIAPRRFTVLCNEARWIGRCEFDRPNVIEHPFDQPQISDTLRLANWQRCGELRDGRRIDRDQILAAKRDPLEEGSPLRAINVSRRLPQALCDKPAIERGVWIATPDFAFLDKEIVARWMGRRHGSIPVSCAIVGAELARGEVFQEITDVPRHPLNARQPPQARPRLARDDVAFCTVAL